MNQFQVIIIEDPSKMQKAFPLVVLLSEHLTESAYAEMVREMVKHTYKQIWVMDGEALVGVSGFWILTKLYSNKYLEMDNVVVDPRYRSMGIGKILVDTLTDIAVKNQCKMMMLDAYVSNRKGHSFYFREGFHIAGFHFLKKVDG